MGQEECPLLPTDVYCCLDQQQENKQRNTLLLIISNKRIDMETTGIDWSRVNMEEELRGLSDKKKVERMGLVKIIMENNIKMLEMQKII